MKYLKFYENFKQDYTFFDNMKYYDKILYRGISESELKKYKDKGELGYFFTEDYDFAEDYGDYIIEVKLKTHKVFNSHDPRNIEKLYEEGYKLTDEYIHVSGDSNRYPTYDFEKNEFSTAEAYFKSIHQSDTWDIIENSDVIPHILEKYDAIHISEGGISNYYIVDGGVIEFVKIHEGDE